MRDPPVLPERRSGTDRRKSDRRRVHQPVETDRRDGEDRRVSPERRKLEAAVAISSAGLKTVASYFGPILRFFGALGASLTGITAVLTAIGYLAEVSRFRMLGFTSVPIDLNQYVITGGRFFAFLPIAAISAALLGVTYVARKHTLALAAAVISAAGLWFTRRVRFVQRICEQIRVKARASLFRHLTAAFVVLVAAQAWGLSVSFQVSDVSNVLFEERVPPNPASRANALQTTAPEPSTRSQRLVASIQGRDVDALFRHLALLLTIAAGSAVVLFMLASWHGERVIARPRRWRDVWLASNVLLLGTQLVLLPVNYGALLSPNRFPVVHVSLTEAIDSSAEWPTDGRFFLLNSEGGTYFLYARDPVPRIWSVRQEQTASIVYLGVHDVFDSGGVREERLEATPR